MAVLRLPVSIILLYSIFPLSHPTHEMIIQNGKIVELKESKDNGARLLATEVASDLSECSHLCLKEAYCNTAIYHEEDYGKQNCFLLWCGVPNKCVFSDRPKYTALLRTSMDSEELEPVDCQLSSWMVEAPCSVSCGLGVVTYSRTVVKEAKNGGQPCSGDDQLTLHVNISCVRLPCTVVNCQVSAWTSFTECSTTCGRGVKTRYRDIVQMSSGGGVACPPFENLQQSIPCEERACYFWNKPILDPATEAADQNYIAGVSDTDSIAGNELDKVIDEDLPTVDRMSDQTSSPTTVHGFNQTKTMNTTTDIHPSTPTAGSDMQMLEQELMDEATQADAIYDVDVEFSKKVSPDPTHSTIKTTPPGTPETLQRPFGEQPAVHVISTEEPFLSQSKTASIPKSGHEKQSASSASTEYVHTRIAPSITHKQPFLPTRNSESAQSVKQNLSASITPLATSGKPNPLRTENPVSVMLTTYLTNTGITENESRNDGIELLVENVGSDFSDTTTTVVLVVALIVGILFVTASFMVMARHWYGSGRRRRLHTQMEYLLNDVSD